MRCIWRSTIWFEVMMFKERVWAVAKKIPRGRVSTYGEIARALGCKGASRAVGNALNANRSKSVPCHRIVRSGGALGGFNRGSAAKSKKLEAEGVRVKRGKIARFESVFYQLS